LEPSGRAQDSGVMELIDDARGATVADPQPALEQGCGAALVLDAQLGRVAEELDPGR
jgi:hypothetical protein